MIAGYYKNAGCWVDVKSTVTGPPTAICKKRITFGMRNALWERGIVFDGVNRSCTV